MIFLGPLYSPNDEEQLLMYSSCGLSNASNKFQINLIDGFLSNNIDLRIVNVLPVGTWPNNFKKFCLNNTDWDYFGIQCTEIGCINLPFIKQYQREMVLRKVLKQLVSNDSEIIIYSTYLPFLKAIKNLPNNVNITLIVTDLPEFYDLGRVSKIKKFLRNVNNKIIYRCLDRVNRFVLLTEHMADFLKVSDKPYTVIEGIWSGQNSDFDSVRTENTTKKIIFYAGTLHKQFGIVNLLDAFALIDNNYTELWLCGTGDSESEIMSRADKDSRIKFFGYVSSAKVNELRKNADVLVNPRQNDGEYTKYSFPSKTMEYLASGIPVVAFKLDGIPEEYSNYMNFVSGNSAVDLRNTLIDVLVDNNFYYSQKAKRAVEFLKNEKSATVQAKKIYDMISES